MLRIARGIIDDAVLSNPSDATDSSHSISDPRVDPNIVVKSEGCATDPQIVSTESDCNRGRSVETRTGTTRVLAAYAVSGAGLALCGVGYDLSMKHGNSVPKPETSKRKWDDDP